MDRGAQPGNQNAKKGRLWTEALKRALARYSGSTVDAGLDKLADKLVKAAAESDDKEAKDMIERIADRVEGKAVQVIAGSDDHPPIQQEGRIRLVRPEGDE
jgi:hypothetical protein